MDAASSVVSVSVTPVYNAADFVCALSQRRMKYTGAIDLGCALERSKLPTLKRSFYDEMAASCRYLDAIYSAQATQDPEAVYNRVCIACHAGQLLTDPRPVVGKPGGQELSKVWKRWCNTSPRVSRRCRRVVCAWTAVSRLTDQPSSG